MTYRDNTAESWIEEGIEVNLITDFRIFDLPSVAEKAL